MMSDETLSVALARLAGKPVWRVANSPATAPVVRIHLGSVLPPLETLKKRFSDFPPRGEFVVMLRGQWELVRDGLVTATSEDDPADQEPAFPALESLVGQTVSRAQAQADSRDLVIEFSDGSLLQALVTQKDDNAPCYSILLPAGWVSVDDGGNVSASAPE
jgi:hypothetical protein